eukprot:m.90500 g.90500  ORF g.90500 m.90500 type:complete len:52 (+) comp11852_c0_seq1:40-195(+)
MRDRSRVTGVSCTAHSLCEHVTVSTQFFIFHVPGGPARQFREHVVIHVSIT